MCDLNKIVLFDFWNIIKEADASFRVYECLLKMRSNNARLRVYNEMPTLFHYITNMALYDSILKSTKLMDPKKQGKNDNKTLEYLVELINVDDRDISEKINMRFYELKKIYEKFKDIRNKEIAHLDLSTERDEILSYKTRNDLRNLLDKQLEFINIYRDFLKVTDVPYFFFDNHFLAKDLGKLSRLLFRNYR